MDAGEGGGPGVAQDVQAAKLLSCDGDADHRLEVGGSSHVPMMM